MTCQILFPETKKNISRVLSVKMVLEQMSNTDGKFSSLSSNSLSETSIIFLRQSFLKFSHMV